MDGLHWPGYEIVCHFSVDEVALEIPAFFEDILILQDVWARLIRNALEYFESTHLILGEATLLSFDAHRA